MCVFFSHGDLLDETIRYCSIFNVFTICTPCAVAYAGILKGPRHYAEGRILIDGDAINTIHTYLHVFNVPLRIQHGRPKSKGAGHALNALYVGTPLTVCYS